jgi:WD40 repeat protein
MCLRCACVQLIRRFSGHHTHEITAMAFMDKDERYIVSVASDKSLRIWDTKSEENTPIWKYFLPANAIAVQATDEKTIFVGDSLGNLCLLRVSGLFA